MSSNKSFIPIDKVLQMQHFALLMEYEYEKEAYCKHTEMKGVEQGIRQGICWYPISIGRNYYNALNAIALEITRSSEIEYEHNFEYGRSVRFFHRSYDGKITFLNFTATVNYAEENRMVILLPNQEALNVIHTHDTLGVQLYFDETSYRTMFEALNDVLRAKENRLGELKEIVLGNKKPSFREIFPMRFPWLNSSQELAVNRVLCAKDVAVVHGPPGTGKTTTLVEAIYETLHREHQVLVCAQSNTAVDWIAEKLADRGVSVLRIGNPSRVTDKMLSFTYERQFENHPSYSELWSARKAIRELIGSLRQKNASEKEKIRNRLHKLRDRATELEILINEELFGNARVIASTLVSSNHRVLTGRSFPTLFIDEAAQALEAACWIAIRKADRVVFAGDHYQLPPTIKCLEAARSGLSQTLMERICLKKPEAVTLLDTQYRMNEAIMHFPAQWFYKNRLKAAPDVRYRGILDFDTPITWIDTAEMEFKEEYRAETAGRINKEEAKLLLEELERYIRKIGETRIMEERIDFGVISPYKAQVQYLRTLMKKSSFFRPYRKLITIHTVDGFQGQERDVIFISLVRANEDGQIGFLNDLRRMNVAITRARMKLVILGDSSTLEKHPFYNKLITYIRELEE